MITDFHYAPPFLHDVHAHPLHPRNIIYGLHKTYGSLKKHEMVISYVTYYNQMVLHYKVHVILFKKWILVKDYTYNGLILNKINVIPKHISKSDITCYFNGCPFYKVYE